MFVPLIYSTPTIYNHNHRMTAPCYKRMRNGGREADFPERMEQRALETAQFIRWVSVFFFLSSVD